MSGSQKKSDDASTYNDRASIQPTKEEFSDLNTQMRMISESLVACKQISSHKSNKKEADRPLKNQKKKLQNEVQILLREKTTQECFSLEKKKSFMVCYMLKNEKRLKNFQKSKMFFSKKEILSKKCSDSDSEDESCSEERLSIKEVPELYRGTSKVGMYRHEEIDPDKMIEIIQRELKVLMWMAPAAAVLVSKLSDAVFHYKKCSKCSKKINSSLPWILNRIQKLIKYITEKKQETYIWPNDLNYLRRPPKKEIPEKSLIRHQSKKITKKDLKETKKEIGRLEEVEACVIADDKPGVQILLEVKAEKKKKRFFDKSQFLNDQKAAEVSRRRFPTLRFSEPLGNPLVQILRPEANLKISFNKKQEFSVFKEHAFAFHLKLLQPKGFQPDLALVYMPKGLAVSVQSAQAELHLKPIEPYEERVLIFNLNSLYNIIQQTGYYVEESDSTNENSEPKENELFAPVLMTDGSELVRKLLVEAKGEKMEYPKRNDLRSEVKSLKDLVLEVHKNQVELSKLLLEKGICSPPMIKLTDPNMLREENRLIKQASQFDGLVRKTASIEALQVRVEEIKQKCNVKNKMILNLLKGLRSDVPKEWWEELVDYIFDESKPIDEFDPEKVSEFIRQTSLFLLKNEKAASMAPPTSRTEEQPSEGKRPGSDLTTAVQNSGNLDPDLDFKAGMQEFLDSITWNTEVKKIIQGFGDPLQSSSFIHNILYEDSCAGVAVVDLFVAVKTAKDDLDLLTQFNDEVWSKINILNEETGDMKKQFKILLGRIQELFDKLDAEPVSPRKLNSESQKQEENNNNYHQPDLTLQNKQKEDKELGTEPKPTEVEKIALDFNPTAMAADECSTCGNSRIQSLQKVGLLLNNFRNGDSCFVCETYHLFETGNMNSCSTCGSRWQPSENLGCLCCLSSLIGSQDLTITPENFVRVMMAFVLCLCKMFEVNCLPSSEKLTAQVLGYCQEYLEVKGSERSINLTESTVQMICDICEVLVKQQESEIGIQSFLEKDSEGHFSNEIFQESDIEKPEIETQEKNLTEGKAASNSEKTDSDAEDYSECESVFEEALSEPFPTTVDSQMKPSVTCMGDLTKIVKEKKSTATFTNELKTSWISKLKEDIKSKIKNFSTCKKQVMVKKKLETTALPETVEFTINANTPAGVFDVTVRQFKDRRRKSEKLLEMGTSSNFVVAPGNVPLSPTGFQDVRIPGDDYFSGASFSCPDLENVEVNSSSDDDMEEFIEIYVENARKETTNEKNGFSTSGALQTALLKTDKAPFFEIQKCQPKYFLQEIFPKIGKSRGKNSPDRNANKKIISVDSEQNVEESQHKVVIKDSSNELIIYIQVELEEEDEILQGRDVFVKCNESSQTQPVRITDEVEELEKEDTRLLWEESELFIEKEEESDEETLKTALSDPVLVTDRDEAHHVTEKPKDVPKTSLQIVKFYDEVQQVSYEEKTMPEIARTWDKAEILVMMHINERVDIFIPQNEILELYRTELKTQLESQLSFYEPQPEVELEKALELIHEIENNIVDVKLSDAILILPQLESELRKHLQQKIKSLSEHSSADRFFSTVDLWSSESEDDGRSDDSEERLENLLNLLSNLEEAIKTKSYPEEKLELCDEGSSKIYKLLKALTSNIRDLEDEATLGNLAETMEIASRLDTAVREYDSVIKNQPLNCIVPARELDSESERKPKEIPKTPSEETSVKEHLKNVRKKVFEIVEAGAVDTEQRIEKDFDRLDRLERENEEALKFVEAFLEKTERRTAELGSVKEQLKDLSRVLNEFYEVLSETKSAESKATQNKESKDRSVLTKPSGNLGKEKPIRNTASGLMMALNDLKIRAKEKGEVCKEILGGSSDLVKLQSEPKISRSSLTSKHPEELTSYIKDFREIGNRSLYLSWSKPEGPSADSITGYEILVNGKLNQKVRNPQRLQAVLYSVDLAEEVTVQLNAVIDNKMRILLATVTNFYT